jgi:hypothetical protein
MDKKMPKTLFLIFNHELTAPQREDAATSLGVQRFVDLPPELNSLWATVPPALERLMDYLEPLKRWLAKEAKRGDCILIQGDFGAAFVMVNVAFAMNLVPVYSTTDRLATEARNGDGSVKTTHLIRHVAFRKYEAAT